MDYEVGNVVDIKYRITDDMTLYQRGVIVEIKDDKYKIKITEPRFAQQYPEGCVEIVKKESEWGDFYSERGDDYCTLEKLS